MVEEEGGEEGGGTEKGWEGEGGEVTKTYDMEMMWK